MVDQLLTNVNNLSFFQNNSFLIKLFKNNIDINNFDLTILDGVFTFSIVWVQVVCTLHKASRPRAQPESLDN